MFGFGKKKKKNRHNGSENEKPAKKTRADKIVMGAILGVAIGSVISVSLMPKNKNKENSSNAKGSSSGKPGLGFFKKRKEIKKTTLAENPKKIPTENE